MADVDRRRLVDRAIACAARAHQGQTRKYTGEPYITHPLAVACAVASVTDEVEIIAAAVLHDVVEDTAVTLDEIRAEFGDRVADLVGWVTDVSKPEDGNRAARKAIDREHLAAAPAEAQTIKLADLIDNTASIVERDPAFARVYLREKTELLAVLTKGDPRLLARAVAQIEHQERARP